MFESKTYDSLITEMISMISSNVDTREGSLIYDALAPIAYELSLIYEQLDVVLDEVFVDTASREYLILRCLERDLEPTEATCGVFKAVFNLSTVPIGSLFALEGYTYEVISQIDSYSYKLEVSTAGTEPNEVLGSLTPISEISGLTTATLTEVLILGEDEESTESLRARYFANISAASFSGNVADYCEKVEAISGVGGAKVVSAWAGGGTVKVLVLSSDYGVTSSTLLSEIKEVLDPSDGDGLGLAPIGHVVTVASVEECEIDLEFTLDYDGDNTWDDVESLVLAAINDYFLELAQSWSESDAVIVRISQLETRILACLGVVDIYDTTINGVAKNLTLEVEEIPVLGSVNG